MPTKTFSGRAEERDLRFADALAREQFGVSFGTYCATTFIQALKSGAELPHAPESEESKRKHLAIAAMKRICDVEPINPDIGRMSDAEIKDLIASRYE